jgi:hypothetical protein
MGACSWLVGVLPCDGSLVTVFLAVAADRRVGEGLDVGVGVDVARATTTGFVRWMGVAAFARGFGAV